MGDAKRPSEGRNYRRVRWALLVLVIAGGAGLLLRSLLVLDGVDSGTRADDLLTMMVGAGGPGPGGSDPGSMSRKYEAYQREVEQVPGVRAVAWGTGLPFDGLWYTQAFQIDGDPPRLHLGHGLGEAVELPRREVGLETAQRRQRPALH